MQFWRESMSNKRWHKLVCYVYRDGGYVHASNPLHEKIYNRTNRIKRGKKDVVQ